MKGLASKFRVLRALGVIALFVLTQSSVFADIEDMSADYVSSGPVHFFERCTLLAKSISHKRHQAIQGEVKHIEHAHTFFDARTLKLRALQRISLLMRKGDKVDLGYVDYRSYYSLITLDLNQVHLLIDEDGAGLYRTIRGELVRIDISKLRAPVFGDRKIEKLVDETVAFRTYSSLERKLNEDLTARGDLLIDPEYPIAPRTEFYEDFHRIIHLHHALSQHDPKMTFEKFQDISMRLQTNYWSRFVELLTHHARRLEHINDVEFITTPLHIEMREFIREHLSHLDERLEIEKLFKNEG